MTVATSVASRLIFVFMAMTLVAHRNWLHWLNCVSAILKGITTQPGSGLPDIICDGWQGRANLGRDAPPKARMMTVWAIPRGTGNGRSGNVGMPLPPLHL